jgi:hypothetical protein
MSVPLWCRIGAKVVCVNDEAHVSLFGNVTPCTLAKGDIYIITHVGGEMPFAQGNFVGVRVSGHENPQSPGGWYGISRFRPLVDTTTADEVERRLFRKKRLHQPVSARLTA